MQFTFSPSGVNQWISPARDGNPQATFSWAASKMTAGTWRLVIGNPGEACQTIYKGTGGRWAGGKIQLSRFRAGCLDCMKKSPLSISMMVPAEKVTA